MSTRAIQSNSTTFVGEQYDVFNSDGTSKYLNSLWFCRKIKLNLPCGLFITEANKGQSQNIYEIRKKYFKSQCFLKNYYKSYSLTTLTKATWHNFIQIERLNIVEVNNNFPTNYPKWPQFCCLCYVQLDYKAENLLETIVNLHDFYSLNLWRILLGGLDWSSHTVINLLNPQISFYKSQTSLQIRELSLNPEKYSVSQIQKNILSQIPKTVQLSTGKIQLNAELTF